MQSLHCNTHNILCFRSTHLLFLRVDYHRILPFWCYKQGTAQPSRRRMVLEQDAVGTQVAAGQFLPDASYRIAKVKAACKCSLVFFALSSEAIQIHVSLIWLLKLFASWKLSGGEAETKSRPILPLFRPSVISDRAQLSPHPQRKYFRHSAKGMVILKSFILLLFLSRPLPDLHYPSVFKGWHQNHS